MWQIYKLFTFLILIGISTHSFAIGGDIDGVPRPGSNGELSIIIDQAIKKHRRRLQRQKKRRKRDFLKQFRTGHEVEFYEDPQKLLSRRIKHIRSAKKSIYLATFIYDTDKSGIRIAKELCAQASRGLEVKILIDSYGGGKFYNGYADRLRSCGAGILKFNPPIWDLADVAYIMHEKLLIVDGEAVMMGGNGIQNSYHHIEPAHKFYHDMEAKIKGPAACWFHKKFVEVYKESILRSQPIRLHGERPRSRSYNEFLYGTYNFSTCEYKSFGDAKVRPAYNNPLFSPETKRPLFESYYGAFSVSEKEIMLYSPYFVPHNNFISLLLWARRRGIEVTVITNSIHSNDEGVETLVGMAYKVGKLMKAGVKIRLWDQKTTMHRKGGIFDRKYAFIGSDNLDTRGHNYSSESIAFIEDENFVSKMTSSYERDLENTIPLTKEYIQEILNSTGSFTKWAIRNILIDYL